MRRMLVVVFDHETKAYESKKALMQLDATGSIDVYADAVVAKNADGTMAVKDADDYDGPIGTLVGTAFGGLIGLLGGPVGLAIGLGAGGLAGAAIDVNKANLGWDFIEEVSKILTPDKFALAAEIDENSTTPVDTRMEAIGGTVFRRALSDVKQTLHEEHVAARQADHAQMKAECAEARANRKAKLRETLNKLDSRIQDQLQKAKDKPTAAERDEQARVEGGPQGKGGDCEGRGLVTQTPRPSSPPTPREVEGLPSWKAKFATCGGSNVHTEPN